MINANEKTEKEERLEIIREAVAKVQDSEQELNFDNETKKLEQVWGEL